MGQEEPLRGRLQHKGEHRGDDDGGFHIDPSLKFLYECKVEDDPRFEVECLLPACTVTIKCCSPDSTLWHSGGLCCVSV